MSDKILSISVAAYDLEKLIYKNIESFINSEVREKIEIIVTDDESKDNTAKIVEQYENKYPGIVRLIKQKNAGPGSTVNSGIKHATGKYFKMVDGDDWVVTENLKDIIEYLEKTNVDMVITNYQVFSNKDNQVIKNCTFKLPTNKELNFKDYCKSLDLGMHAVMFKTTILQENNIILDNGFYTDTEYVLLPSEFIKTFSYINLDLYVYLVAQANQSVSAQSMRKNIKMHDFVLNRLIDFYENKKKENVDKNVLIYIRNRIALVAANQLSTYLTYDDKKERLGKIKKFNMELKNKSNDIYERYKKNKKAFLIIYSRYLLTNIVSKLYMKKIAEVRY
ncbi:MAG: glycosyltransferase family 2 protein [Clostridia bacterium]|nr:glycosyltransferase family 2 protein [Clostridia bacterium]